jgi:hypothetical protein
VRGSILGTARGDAPVDEGRWGGEVRGAGVPPRRA